MSPEATTVDRRRQEEVIASVLKAVGKHFSYSTEDLTGTRRNSTLAAARQVAMALSRDIAKASWPDIARAFSKDSHHTAQHAYKVVADKLAHDPDFKRTYVALRAHLNHLHQGKP